MDVISLVLVHLPCCCTLQQHHRPEDAVPACPKPLSSPLYSIQTKNRQLCHAWISGGWQQPSVFRHADTLSSPQTHHRATAGDKLFFDSRDGSTLDLLTVAETAPDPIAEDPTNINGVQQLSVEATKLNHHFSQQVRCPLDSLSTCRSQLSGLSGSC